MSITPYYDHGGITIYHGDCRAVLPLARAMRPRLLLTDPPYGIGFKLNKGNARNPKHHRRAHFPAVEGDNKSFDPSPLIGCAENSILWGANHYADKLPPSPSWFVWDKRDGINSNDQSDFELAWSDLGTPTRIFRHVWSGVIRASENGERHLHPTQKPVALMRWCLVRAGVKRGDLVFDPYMGSGPVAQACHEMGLRYIGVELVESYCDEAVKRLAQTVMVLDLEAA